tara:strand:- start:277 stop:489 length:213 start_codon:yes stop_codon:yes gene_type:complete
MAFCVFQIQQPLHFCDSSKQDEIKMPVSLGGKSRTLHLVSPMKYREQEVIPFFVSLEDRELICCDNKREH